LIESTRCPLNVVGVAAERYVHACRPSGWTEAYGDESGAADSGQSLAIGGHGAIQASRNDPRGAPVDHESNFHSLACVGWDAIEHAAQLLGESTWSGHVEDLAAGKRLKHGLEASPGHR
jgi:hypothetical protein